MLAANEAVARHICQLQIPCVYRIHEDPDLEKLRDFRVYAQSFGYKVGDVTHRQELQKTLEAGRRQAGRVCRQPGAVALVEAGPLLAPAGGTLRAGPRSSHSFYVTHPPVRRSDRAPNPAFPAETGTALFPAATVSRSGQCR